MRVFFFKAEDGIRDVAVTGVQTCALPIYRGDEIALVPVFVAFVDEKTEPRVSGEHDGAEWLAPAAAGRRFSWPRERRALEDVLSILGSGDAGLLDDVLRVC